MVPEIRHDETGWPLWGVKFDSFLSETEKPQMCNDMHGSFQGGCLNFFYRLYKETGDKKWIGSGVPGVLLYPEQFGNKGTMWQTIGLAEWLINTDSPDYASRAVATAREILSDPEKTAEKLRRARKIIDEANKNAIKKSFFIE